MADAFPNNRRACCGVSAISFGVSTSLHADFRRYYPPEFVSGLGFHLYLWLMWVAWSLSLWGILCEHCSFLFSQFGVSLHCKAYFGGFRIFDIPIYHLEIWSNWWLVDNLIKDHNQASVEGLCNSAYCCASWAWCNLCLRENSSSWSRFCSGSPARLCSDSLGTLARFCSLLVATYWTVRWCWCYVGLFEFKIFQYLTF